MSWLMTGALVQMCPYKDANCCRERCPAWGLVRDVWIVKNQRRSRGYVPGCTLIGEVAREERSE